MKKQIRKINKMSFRSCKRYNSVQAAELLLADSVVNSGLLSDFSSDGEDSDIDQSPIQISDLDASNAGHLESDSEYEEESDVV